MSWTDFFHLGIENNFHYIIVCVPSVHGQPAWSTATIADAGLYGRMIVRIPSARRLGITKKGVTNIDI